MSDLAGWIGRLSRRLVIAALIVDDTTDDEGEDDNPYDDRNHPLTLYDDNRNGRISCAEARAHGIAPVYSNHPAYRYMTDRDGDDVVCE